MYNLILPLANTRKTLQKQAFFDLSTGYPQVWLTCGQIEINNLLSRADPKIVADWSTSTADPANGPIDHDDAPRMGSGT